jgi:hypothetical protein
MNTHSSFCSPSMAAVKFEIKRVPPTPERPHGLRYSLTLHDPQSRRLIGFDNAHAVPAALARFRKRPSHFDHWHRHGREVRPYRFESVEQLLTDFESEVIRMLRDRGIDLTVIGEGSTREGNPE